MTGWHRTCPVGLRRSLARIRIRSPRPARQGSTANPRGEPDDRARLSTELPARARRRVHGAPPDKPPAPRDDRSRHREPGRRSPRHRRGGAQVLRQHRGPVVRLARIQRRAAREGRLRADEHPRLLPHVSSQLELELHRPCRAAPRDRPRADVESAIPVLGLRGERRRHQAHLVLPQRARPAREDQGHRPADGLPREHHRGGERVRQGGHARRLQPPAPDVPPHRHAALLPRTRGRGERRRRTPSGWPRTSSGSSSRKGRRRSARSSPSPRWARRARSPLPGATSTASRRCSIGTKCSSSPTR